MIGREREEITRQLKKNNEKLIQLLKQRKRLFLYTQQEYNELDNLIEKLENENKEV